VTRAIGESAGSPRSRWLAWGGFGLGLVLLIGAIWVVLGRDPDAMAALFERLRDAPWWAGALIAVGPVVNWLLVSSCLWMLLRRHGELGWGEMNALVGSAWLLNHLPMRPGLIGRVGYHKLVNGIRVRDAIESTVWSLGLAAVAGVMGLALAFALPRDAGLAPAVAVLGGPVLVVGALGAGCALLGRVRSGWLLGALALRYADLGTWSARYAVVFWVMGLEVSPVQIIVITGVSQVAQLIPIAGGGLGLREWLVAITAGWFADASAAVDGAGTAVSGGLSGAFDAAMAADLVNRAVETLVVVPVGLIGGWMVARNVRRVRKAGSRAPVSGANA